MRITPINLSSTFLSKEPLDTSSNREISLKSDLNNILNVQLLDETFIEFQGELATRDFDLSDINSDLLECSDINFDLVDYIDSQVDSETIDTINTKILSLEILEKCIKDSSNRQKRRKRKSDPYPIIPKRKYSPSFQEKIVIDVLETKNIKEVAQKHKLSILKTEAIVKRTIKQIQPKYTPELKNQDCTRKQFNLIHHK